MSIATPTFLDIGASKGGSIKWAEATFGGTGLGIDISPKKIEMLKAKGFNGVVADARTLDFDDNSVAYIVMSDFLEHLPSREDATAIIKSALRVASDFVVIRGPDFGGENYLRSKGFYKYFARWSGHKWHHTAADFEDILSAFNLPYIVIQHNKIADSYHNSIQQEGPGKNLYAYDADAHGPKSFLKFERKIYDRLLCIVCKGKTPIEQILCRCLPLRIVAGQRLPKLYDEAPTTN